MVEPEDEGTEQTEDEPEEDFASMLEASFEAAAFREGDSVEGVVVALGTDVAFVDIGGKGEATIDLAELSDEDGNVEAAVGDKVKALVVSTSGGVKLSQRLARQAATREALRDAFGSGLPVEGKVEKAIKGGFDVRFAGQRAFCPISQIDLRYTEDPAVHEGKTYEFRVVEYKDDGKNIVVSRRALLEEQAAEEAEAVRAALVPDAVLTGRAVSLQEYGAFVDLGGGVQGLLHVSEMGWSRVTNPGDVVQPGDTITVKVLRVDEEKGRISLGLKQLQADPWSTVEERYRIGQVVAGRVVRLADFGAFVEIESGVEGLAHVSTFPPAGRADDWKDAVAPGTEVAAEILSLEPDRKRLGLAVVEEGTERAASAKRAAATDIAPGARLTGKVKSHESYGVFVFLSAGHAGLIPLEETGVERGGDVEKAFPVGSDVDVVVLEVDPSRRRIRLSARAAAEAKERGELREYQETQRRSERESFGSLADKLRGAFERDSK